MVAKVLKKLSKGKDKNDAVDEFTTMFAKDNSRFNKALFYKACGYSTDEIGDTFGVRHTVESINENRSFDGFGSAVTPMKSIGMTSDSGALKLRDALKEVKGAMKLERELDDLDDSAQSIEELIMEFWEGEFRQFTKKYLSEVKEVRRVSKPLADRLDSQLKPLERAMNNLYDNVTNRIDDELTKKKKELRNAERKS